jgi:hypothetical protein
MKEFNTFSHVLSTCQTGNLGELAGQYIYPHFKTFIEAFALLNIEINKNKQYSEKELVDCVFLTRINRNDTVLIKNYLKRKFHVANSYLQYLFNKVDESTIQKHLDTLQLICTDYSELLELIYHYKVAEPKEKFERLRWRRKTKHIFQLYNDAQNFFAMLEFNNVEGVKFYDMEPYSIFAMRQLIEEMGKGILGIISITDSNGNPAKNTTAPWEFIKEEVKKTSKRIFLNFDIYTIINMEKWSNSFIHTTFSSDIFTIWQALVFLKSLIKTCQEPVTTYNNHVVLPSHNVPDIRIHNYLSLRKDFEQFINNRKDLKKLQVIWVDYEKWGVEGCIMSL